MRKSSAGASTALNTESTVLPLSERERAGNNPSAQDGEQDFGDPALTVFISNLDFRWAVNDILPLFENVKEIRLVMRGRSNKACCHASQTVSTNFISTRSTIQQSSVTLLPITYMIVHERPFQGYGYIDFFDEPSAKAAVAKDRMVKINNRPIFVSAYKPHKKGDKADFKFGTGLEKTKLFVRNVHYACTQDELRVCGYIA